MKPLRHRCRLALRLARQSLGRLACALAVAAVGEPATAQAAASSAAGSMPTARLRIVAGLAGLNAYNRHEEPFWTRTLPALTQGQVTAEIVPFDRAGIRGQDMLRLLQQGVVTFGNVQLSLSQADDALLGAPDLAGLNPDMATLRSSVAAFRPVLAKHLRDDRRLELLAIYAYPAQVAFCNKPFSTLADLAGRRIRVSSVAQADLVEALGAQPVYTSFADLLPQMRSAALDCAITGTMSGHTIGLAEATTHLHTQAIGWGLSVFVANGAAWAGLSPALRSLLLKQLPQLEQAIWAEADRETGEGIACNSGAKACDGARGTMQVVQPTAADRQRLRALVGNTVLPRWLGRCGPSCATVWNQTLAPVTGLTAQP